MRAQIIFLAAIAAASPSIAGDWSGSAYLSVCLNKSKEMYQRCFDYTKGVIYGAVSGGIWATSEFNHSFNDRIPDGYEYTPFCNDENTHFSIIISEVISYIVNTEGAPEEPASFSIIASLRANYPCE